MESSGWSLNKLKLVEDDIGGYFIDSSNVLLELKRISHRQFPWQKIANHQKMIRYWQVFSRLEDYFEEVYGIPFTHFYVICLALFGIFTKKFMIDYPPRFELGVVNQSTLDHVLNFIADDYYTLSSKLRSELSMYHDYVYKFHSLTALPLIIIDIQGEKKLMCPLSTYRLHENILFHSTPFYVFYLKRPKKPPLWAALFDWSISKLTRLY